MTRPGPQAPGTKPEGAEPSNPSLPSSGSGERPEIRRVRPDDYEPWLAEMIERGEVEPPDEFVIEDQLPACLECAPPDEFAGHAHCPHCFTIDPGDDYCGSCGERL